MSPQTLKMIILFFLAAALLNLTNYLFYWFYDPPSHKAVKVSLSLKVPKTRYFFTKSRVTHSIEWTNSLICVTENDKNNSNNEVSREEDVVLDYRDQSSETNSFYYYNGIRRGPVMCPEEPSGLGPIKPKDMIDLDAIENLYSVLQPGGIYEESECVARQTVAIIVPYRGDKSQLTEFLYSVHPILIKQQSEYQIFVVEQGKLVRFKFIENFTLSRSLPLNLGKLFNAGFTEAQRMKKNGGWRCMIFHHHDLVPADTRNLYRCNEHPEQLAVALVSNNTHEYPFGGAITIKPRVFSKVNGFSNLYVGNDAIYDDLFKRYQTIQTPSPLNLLDGLSTLTYTLNNIELKPLYTLIEVDLDKESVQSQGTIGEKLWDRLLNHATSSQETKPSESKARKN